VTTKLSTGVDASALERAARAVDHRDRLDELRDLVVVAECGFGIRRHHETRRYG
jgi:hypothetical protein